MKTLVQHQFDQTRYEKNLAASGSVLASQVAGISRVVRLNNPPLELHQKAIWDTSANIAAPAFYFFNLWVLQQAENMGIKRLYFISRDGQIHFKIANIICKKLGIDIECRYLYGSTHSWSFPLLAPGEIKQRIEEIIQSNLYTYEQLFLLCNLDQDTQKKITTDCDVDVQILNQTIVPTENSTLNRFVKSDDFLQLVQDQVGVQFQNTWQYLKQEGLTDDIQYGFVPFLWSGRSIQRLYQIMKKYDSKFKREIHGFYFAYLDKIEFEDGHFHLYLGDHEPEFHTINSINIDMLEVFASADHPTVMSFAKERSGYVPVLNMDKQNENLEWGLERQHQSILKFAELSSDLIKGEVPSYSEICLSFLKNFKLLLELPDRVEAEIYGKFRFSSISHDTHLKELAPPQTKGKIVQLLFGRNVYQFRDVNWIQGAIMISTKGWGRFLVRLLNLRFSLGRWKRKIF